MNCGSPPGGTTNTPRRRAVGLRLRELHGELRDESRAAAAERDGQARLSKYRCTDGQGDVIQRASRVHAFGPGEIEIPLIDARAFDDRRVLAEDGRDLAALLRARAARDWDAHRLGAKT
jgi:hypothetical protein